MARRRILRTRARPSHSRASDSEVDYADDDGDVTLRVRSFRCGSRTRCFAVYASSDDVRACTDVTNSTSSHRFEPRANDRKLLSRDMTLQELFAVVGAHNFQSPASDNARDLQLLRDVNTHLQQVGRVRIV